MRICLSQILLALVAGVTIPAQLLVAQVSTIAAPFSPGAIESWESFPIQNVPDPSIIMGGLAQISSPRMFIYAPSSGAFWGFGTSGPAQVSDVTQGMGLDLTSQTATIDFAQPITAFGAFWGASTTQAIPSATVSLGFFDSSLNQIGLVQQFSYSRTATQDGALIWHGWSSSIPVRRVTYTGDMLPMMGCGFYSCQNRRLLSCLDLRR
jgi:hypothetical protein